jgi:hypothetical protein
MGNRPKGSRYKYLTVIWGFGILTIYLVVVRSHSFTLCPVSLLTDVDLL